MSAPMSLMSYEEVRPWARAIKQRVVKREMPPWSADPAHGRFKNDPSLPQKDIDTIAAWVDAGAPKGDDSDMPPVPQYADGWTIGTPDAVFTMTEPYKVPADGTIPYQYIRIPTNLAEDKWMQAIEIKPGDRRVVHHVIASAQPAGGNARDERTTGRTSLGGITPNKPGVVYEPGVARLLRANSDIILQMHYTTIGEATTDRTSVAVIYAKEPPQKMIAGGNVINAALRDSRRAPPTTKSAQAATFADDALLTSMMPHMHVRGKNMTYTAKYPDGRKEILLPCRSTTSTGSTPTSWPSRSCCRRAPKLEVVAALRQLDEERFQSRSDGDGAVGRSDVGRDDDRVLLDGRCRPRANDPAEVDRRPGTPTLPFPELGVCGVGAQRVETARRFEFLDTQPLCDRGGHLRQRLGAVAEKLVHLRGQQQHTGIFSARRFRGCRKPPRLRRVPEMGIAVGQPAEKQCVARVDFAGRFTLTRARSKAGGALFSPPGIQRYADARLYQTRWFLGSRAVAASYARAAS